MLIFLDELYMFVLVKYYLGDGGIIGGDDQGDIVVFEVDLICLYVLGYFLMLDVGVFIVMVSFLLWNGDKMYGNCYLLNDILCDKFDFNGFVVGDWNGYG